MKSMSKSSKLTGGGVCQKDGVGFILTKGGVLEPPVYYKLQLLPQVFLWDHRRLPDYFVFQTAWSLHETASKWRIHLRFISRFSYHHTVSVWQNIITGKVLLLHITTLYVDLMPFILWRILIRNSHFLSGTKSWFWKLYIIKKNTVP